MLVEKKRNHNQSTCTVLLDNRNNSTVFWKHVRNSARRKREEPRVKIDCDEWETHLSQRADWTCRQPVASAPQTTPHSETCTEVPELDGPVWEHDVREALVSLKSEKAAELDEVLVEYLKHAGDAIVPFLTTYFNHLNEHQHFPTDWGRSVIVPIHKGGGGGY
ncbi:hypothetical protein BaRGS_00027856 [Batillaria attramentaria]|uniref:Uncharacterized protein n=1 Tax=Batillaria attramentaria TaxID=370345 RepID=A0ABD0K1K2_9CAEN